MDALSNGFLILNLDAEDDKEQIDAIIDAKNEGGNKKKGGVSSKRGSKKDDKSVGREYKQPLVPLDLEMTGSNKKNGGVSAKGGSEKDFKSVEGEYNKPLVWIDLEMTGLDIEVDRILEIACIVTDGKLTKSVEGPDLVISQPKESLDNMGEWCRTHHAASGLTERVLQSTVTERDAEKQVIEFIKKHIGSDTPLLAGNSVYVDLLFLKKYMPGLAAIFPHVLVDVSSIVALCIRWFPKEKRQAPLKGKNHRAMEDIRESIRELKYYKESIFKAAGKSKR